MRKVAATAFRHQAVALPLSTRPLRGFSGIVYLCGRYFLCLCTGERHIFAVL